MYGIETTTTRDGATIEIIRDLWCCMDCTMMHANGEDCSEDGGHAARMGAYLGGDYDAGWRLTSDGPADDEDETADHCEFSWSECDGCGSRLGGNRTRHALVRVTRPPRAPRHTGGAQ